MLNPHRPPRAETHNTVCVSPFVRRRPVHTWTTRPLVYVVVVQGIVTAALCFGSNFGIAVALFRDQSSSSSPKMWEFPIPLAADLFMVGAIQTLLTYTLAGFMAVNDIRTGLVPPLGPGALPGWWPREGDAGWLAWCLQVHALMLPPSAAHTSAAQRTCAGRFKGYLLHRCV